MDTHRMNAWSRRALLIVLASGLASTVLMHGETISALGKTVSQHQRQDPPIRFADIIWQSTDAQDASWGPASRAPAHDAAPAGRLLTAGDAASGDEMFRKTFALLESGQFQLAVRTAQQLVHRYPNFQLGQLLYAELLLMTSGQAPQADPWLHGLQMSRRLKELQLEGQRRLQRSEQLIYQGQVPANIVHITSGVSKVVVVDASRSRLYLFEVVRNELTEDIELNMVFDAYASVGMKGIGKQREGDGKTPIGVFFIQKYLRDSMLPDLYGSGAFTLDYPSPVDKHNGKTGSGIWLHGTPSHQYARPPQSTDGCVVMANDDMSKLIGFKLAQDTPVLIVDQLNWVDAYHRGHDWRSMNRLGQAPNPWPLPVSVQMSREQWKPVASFQWTEQNQQLAVVSYARESSAGPASRLHSYWLWKDDRWQEIVR